MHRQIRYFTPDYGSDYESFTKPWFSADMNRVRGLLGYRYALLERDHRTRNE